MSICTEQSSLPAIESSVNVRLIEGVVVSAVVTGHGQKDGKPSFDFDYEHRTRDGQMIKASKWAWPEQVQPEVHGNVQNTTVPKVERAFDQGLRLRTQALALLQEAHAADGLKPFTVTHTHSYGESTYVLWAAETPTQEHAKAVLDCEFEPDREETLAVEDCFTLEEMTGVAMTARLQDILDSSESPCQDDTPSP